MRGFPLLNVLIVIAFFALAWRPLQQVLNDQNPAAEKADAGAGPEPAGEENFSLRTMSSHPIASVTVSHLGIALLTIDEPGEDLDSLDFGHDIGSIEIPPEGVEFWIKVSFEGAADGSRRPAVSLELTPEDLEREPRTVTLWGRRGETTIEAPAVFLWPETSD